MLVLVAYITGYGVWAAFCNGNSFLTYHIFFLVEITTKKQKGISCLPLQSGKLGVQLLPNSAATKCDEHDIFSCNQNLVVLLKYITSTERNRNERCTNLRLCLRRQISCDFLHSKMFKRHQNWLIKNLLKI